MSAISDAEYAILAAAAYRDDVVGEDGGAQGRLMR
jgi:hypothetical protein